MYGKMERITDAITWYNEMIRCNVAPSIVTYAAIIDMFSKAHSYDQALNWVNEMINNGIAPNVYELFLEIFILSYLIYLRYIFSIIIDMYGKLQEPEKVIYWYLDYVDLFSFFFIINPIGFKKWKNIRSSLLPSFLHRVLSFNLNL